MITGGVEEEDTYYLHHGMGQPLLRSVLYVGPRHIFGYSESSDWTRLASRPIPSWYIHLGHDGRMSHVLKRYEQEILEAALSLVSMYRGHDGFSHTHRYFRYEALGEKRNDGLTLNPAGNFYDALQSSIDMVSLLSEDDLPRVLCMNWVPPEVKLVIQHRLGGKKDGLQ